MKFRTDKTAAGKNNAQLENKWKLHFLSDPSEQIKSPNTYQREKNLIYFFFLIIHLYT